MATVPVSASAVKVHSRLRSVIIASSDSSFLQRLSETLSGLRWQVREAEGGADVWTLSQLALPEGVIVDSWLPDLELDEFVYDFGRSFPHVDLIVAGGAHGAATPRGPHRHELLYALRRCQDSDTAAWNSAPVLSVPPIDANVSGQSQNRRSHLKSGLLQLPYLNSTRIPMLGTHTARRLQNCRPPQPLERRQRTSFRS